MRLKVEPDVVALAPGDVTDLLVRVHNDGEDTCTPYLQVRGVDPADVLLPDEVVAVPAGSVMTAIVRVRAAADAIPGDQRIAIAAEDLDGSQGAVSATTVLRIGARPDVAVEVDPVASVGRRGAKARTVLRNRSDRRLQVELEGRGEGVLVSFRPSRVTLDPGETKRVPTRMRRARRSWFGEIRHGAVITARGIGAPASTTATFTQKPSVPRPAVRGVAALTALAVWVAATVVVFNRINAEPEAGPDTGVIAGPAAPGPGRTSATGMFEEEADDGVRLPVVIQGTIEGPRDPSGTTVTAERIGFGDRGTTTGLTKVVALAEVKLPRGNVLDVVRTTTDERGRFRIASGLVEEAFYRVTAVRAGFEVGSFIVSTSADQPEVTLVIALEPATGSLAGAVTDATGAPVGGATVVVTDGSAEYTTVTPSEGDDVGRWVLEGLATPATYQVLVSRRGFAAQTLIVELDGGQALRGVDAVLTADLGTIVGRITDANPDPNQPGVAQGVGALTVTLAGPEARETRTLTVAGDLRGTFDLPGLPFGDYSITFSGDGWETRQAEVTVDRGLVRLDATVNRSTGLVQGWVWQVATGPTSDFPGAFQGECRFPRIDQRAGDGASASGTRPRPCGGVAVSVESDEGDVFATATASETGFFQIGGVPAGEYTLTLSRPGYLSDVRSIVVRPGGTFELNPARTAAVLSVADAVAGTDFVALDLAPAPAVCAGSVLLTLIDFRDGIGIDPVTDASAPEVVTVSNAGECDPELSISRIGVSGTYLLQNVPLGPQTITVGGAPSVWPYQPVTINAQVSPLDRVAVSQNILPRPRTLKLPAGTIRLEGPTGVTRSVVVEVIDSAGANVGPSGGTVVSVSGNGVNAEVDVELVGPARGLRLRAVGGGSPARGYETVTSGTFDLPAGIEPFALPLLAGPDESLTEPRLSLVATTTVTGRIFGFSASPLALAALPDATVTFPAGSRPDASDGNALSVTTGAGGTFTATVRAGTYLAGVTADRASATFGAITVSATGYEERVFNPSGGAALSLPGPTGVLREGAAAFFVVYSAVGGATSGDVGLDPVVRDVTIPVSLLGAATASRSLTVALSGGSVLSVLEGATSRATPTPTPTPPAAAAVTVGTPGAFTFTGVRPGNYTVTVSGTGAVTATTQVTVPVGTGTFTVPSAVEVVATTTVTGTVHGFNATLAVVPMSGATVSFPVGSDPANASGTVTATSADDGTFTATVRSGAYIADAGGLGAVTVTPPDASHTLRTFAVTFADASTTLRQAGVAPFLLNTALTTGPGTGTGEFILDPATRDVRIDVSLLGATGAVRPVTVTLTGGTITGVATTTPTGTASTAPMHPPTVTVGSAGGFGFTAVAPGTYTVTIGGSDHRGLSATLIVAPGIGTLTDARSVQATVAVTVTVSETVVLGATSTPNSPVAGATVAATPASATDGSGPTEAGGTVVLTLDSGAIYGLSVTKAGYEPPSGLTVAVDAATTQTVTVTLLPAAETLRVFGQVSDRVQSVRVLDGEMEVGIATGLGAGTKPYAIDGLPTGKLLRVDFRGAGDTVLVSRWIQSAQAGNVSIQLDQNAEIEDLGTITVDVEVPEAPAGSGVTTPATVTVRLIENVPAAFYSISATGVLEAASLSCTGTPRTCRVTFTGLAKESSSTSLPEKRFTVAIDTSGPTGSASLIPSGYILVGAGSVSEVEVGETRLLKLATIAGPPTIEGIVASTDTLSVTFDAPTNDGGSAPTAYEYSLNGGGFVLRPGTESPLVISGLTPGVLYPVRIRAVNAAGVGVASDPESVITTPAAPTAAAGTESITISWAAPAGATSTVQVSSGGTVVTERPLGGGSLFCDQSTADPKDLTVPGTTCTIGGLTDGTLSYTFSVRITSGDVTSDHSTASSPAVSPTVTATEVATLPDGGCTLTVPDIRCTYVGTHTITFTRIANNARLDYLVVGGGGGGGDDAGGGGGGGAVVIATGRLVGGSMTSLTAVVGAGGAGANHGTSEAAKGGDASSIAEGATTFLTADGGLPGGKGTADAGGTGGAGGSPGGGAGGAGAGTTGTGVSGGAGTVAFDVSYGGGGGGGGRESAVQGSGGDGGGGDGGGGAGTVLATAGTANTGGGGGGGRYSTAPGISNDLRSGAAGGSGIVIIRLGVAGAP